MRQAELARMVALGCVVAAIVTATGTAANAQGRSGAALEKAAVKIGLSVPDPAHLPLHVAEAKGLFPQEGLEVQLVQFESDSGAAQGLTAGAVDINAGSITIVLDSLVANRDLVTFRSDSNLPGYIWYGPAKYSSIKELKGRGRIGISRLGSLTHRISAWAVAQAGLDPEKDVSYIQAGGPLDRVAALKAGQVDVIPATLPGSFLLEQDGFRPLLQLKDVLPEFQFETLYARRGFLRQHPETTKAVVRAWIKAVRWANANRDEATEILMKRLGAKPEERDIYRKTVDASLPYFREDGKFAEKSIDVFLQFYKDQGRIKDIPPHTAFTDYSIIEYFQRNPVR
jgi:NitT/TauT family transport system substrate-binding protein